MEINSLQISAKENSWTTKDMLVLRNRDEGDSKILAGNKQDESVVTLLRY